MTSVMVNQFTVENKGVSNFTFKFAIDKESIPSKDILFGEPVLFADGVIGVLG